MSFQLAGFVNALFYIYEILIFVRIVFSWVGLPSGALLQVYKYVYDLTEPYLRPFRRIIPTAGPIDFSPMIALIVLYIVQNIVVGALR